MKTINKGDIFGRWTVISDSLKVYDNTIRFECICTCGTVRMVRKGQLTNGRSKGCGCDRITHIHKMNNVVTHDDKRLTLYRARYKSDIKDRKNFKGSNLSFDDWLIMVNSPCVYCGNIGSNIIKSRSSDITIQINGIDRVNPLLPYTKENSVPCCKVCNFMKLNYQLNDFKEHIRKIHKHNKGH